MVFKNGQYIGIYKTGRLADVVAPMAVAFFRGSDDNGRTGGVIKDYLLADVCTDVRVGFST